MVGVVDLDQTRVRQIVGVDDAAVVFIMLAAQQGVDFADEGADVRAICGGLGSRFAQGVDVPAGIRVQGVPEVAQLIPGEDAVKSAIEEAVEVGIRHARPRVSR
jgi:hypothetical protein